MTTRDIDKRLKEAASKVQLAYELLGEALEEVEEIRDEQQDCLDNLPDNFKEGPNGTRYQEQIETLDTLYSDIESAQSEVDNLAVSL